MPAAPMDKWKGAASSPGRPGPRCVLGRRIPAGTDRRRSRPCTPRPWPPGGRPPAAPGGPEPPAGGGARNTSPRRPPAGPRRPPRSTGCAGCGPSAAGSPGAPAWPPASAGPWSAARSWGPACARSLVPLRIFLPRSDARSDARSGPLRISGGRRGAVARVPPTSLCFGRSSPVDASEPAGAGAKEAHMATTVTPTAGLDRYFKISERGSSVRTEIIAGLATWLTMAYILFVNPQILGFIGIKDLEPLGLPFKQVLTVTALVAGVMTIAMGVFANYPFALAAGLGLNAFVAFTLVVGHGLSYPQAMGVIVLEGLAITVLVVTGFREAVLNAIPMDLKRAIGIGIVLFFAFGLVLTSALVARRMKGALLIGIIATTVLATIINEIADLSLWGN